MWDEYNLIRKVRAQSPPTGSGAMADPELDHMYRPKIVHSIVSRDLISGHSQYWPVNGGKNEACIKSEF